MRDSPSFGPFSRSALSDGTVSGKPRITLCTYLKPLKILVRTKDNEPLVIITYTGNKESVPGENTNIEWIDIIRVFVESPEPAFVPSEIADRIDCTTEGARYQMEKLVDEGYLSRKKPSQRVVFYWLTPEGHSWFEEKQHRP